MCTSLWDEKNDVLITCEMVLIVVDRSLRMNYYMRHQIGHLFGSVLHLIDLANLIYFIINHS